VNNTGSTVFGKFLYDRSFALCGFSKAVKCIKKISNAIVTIVCTLSFVLYVSVANTDSSLERVVASTKHVRASVGQKPAYMMQ
jgi:hypothetical protein